MTYQQILDVSETKGSNLGEVIFNEFKIFLSETENKSPLDAIENYCSELTKSVKLDQEEIDSILRPILIEMGNENNEIRAMATLGMSGLVFKLAVTGILIGILFSKEIIKEGNNARTKQ